LVPRQLSAPGRVIAGIVVAIAALLALAPTAGAANRRISISNYQWSTIDLQVDLGEHVTWYWIGPDTVHSVTGDSDNDHAIDSDPNNSFPNHDIGDSFQVSFDQPGTYQFRCKLHSVVRGSVTVSDQPGDPVAEPDPVPKSRVDLKAPTLRRLDLASPIRGRGGQLHFALGERAKVDADYYRLDADGERHFAGWARWSGYVGLNEVRFGGRGKHFRALPGRYRAELRATDRNANTGEPRTVGFEIRPR
jgi:plastocyanin